MMPLYNVVPHIDYFNHLIKKKSSRLEFQAALVRFCNVVIREILEWKINKIPTCPT